MTDSESPSQDHRLNSYLKLSDLKQRLEDCNSKNVFIIFDVCFGAQFQPNAHDVPINQYETKLRDIDVSTFNDRMSEGITRVFMASGRYEVPDYWTNSSNHSPFAKKLIYGLEKEKEFISPSKLFGYTMANITKPVLKSFSQQNDSQSDFILSVHEK